MKQTSRQMISFLHFRSDHSFQAVWRKLTVQTGTSFFDDAAKNMASDCDCAESQLMNCFKVEIILKRNDDDSVLLWRWKDENKWELPWFLLRETESFQQEIQRWCSNQLVSNVCGFTLAIVLYVETILKSNVCII